jgi:MYXO-CTERM domain-containing protein
MPSAIHLVATAKPWLHLGRVSLPVTAPLEPRARALLALKSVAPGAEQLGLGALVATAVDTFGDGDRIVRFGQMHRGLPVVGGGAAVRMNALGEVVLTATSLVHALPTSVVPTLPAGAAAKTAQGQTTVPVATTDAKLVVFAMRDGTKLTWAFVPSVPQGLGVAPRILIDAHTGEVLEARDMALHAAATASMYESNPLKSPMLKDLSFAIAPTAADGALVNDFVVSLNCVGDGVLKDLKDQNLSTKVRACELVNSAKPTATGKYDYAPTDSTSDPKSAGSDPFSEVSMYYHATRIYDFFRRLQGDPNAQVVVEKPLRTIANLRMDRALFSGDLASLPSPVLSPASNAFYSPAGGGLGDLFVQLYGFSDGAMWFFQGPRKDYAYDGDVVYHEFTHAVVNATLALESWHADKYGLVDAPGAMNEALADYFSSALAGDPNVGEYASKDISKDLSVIRTLDNQDACPSGVAGEVHNDSTLFSGALWQARESLPTAVDRTNFDKAIYKALRTNPGNGDLGYEDLGNLFKATLTTDFPAGASALTKAFTERGIFPACTRVHTYSGTPLTPLPASGLPGFAAPGNQNLMPKIAIVPGILQAKIAVPNGTKKIKITFDVPKMNGGGNPVGGANGTPFTPKVLVKWGEAITWTLGVKIASDADVTLDPTLVAQSYTAEVNVPDGANVAALQVGNAGDRDGYYRNLAITTIAGEPRPADSPTVPTVLTVPAASPPRAPVEAAPVGCGCAVPDRATKANGFFAAALGVLGVALRRRRRAARDQY